MSSGNSDRGSKQEHMQQEQGVHGEASDRNGGHSGEGAASAMAHMIQQDHKHRRQSGDAEDESPQG